MSTSVMVKDLHLLGEGDSELNLPTLGGKVSIDRTDEALTPYGGLAAWSAFIKHLGWIEKLAQECPLERTSPNAAPVREILHSFLLSALAEGRRFCHVRWLQDDAGVAAMMGIEQVRGEDALRRLVSQISQDQLRSWFRPTEQELFACLPLKFIADWDSTVNTRYGHQEQAERGYNPHKKGRLSHHPLICVAAGSRLCLHMEWRPGDTVSATRWVEAMEQLWNHPTIAARLWLNRGDIGFGQESIMAWHECQSQARPKYLFKLRLTRNVQRAIGRVPWPMWEGCPTVGCQQIAETTVKLSGWSRERRIIIVRTLKPVTPSPQDEFWSTPEDEVAVYVTNLSQNEAKPEQIAILYQKRADTENVFDELKNQWGFRGFCSQKAVVTEAAARLILLAYNLWTLLVRLFGWEPGKHTEAVRSRRQFLILAAQLVKSGRQRLVKIAVTTEAWRVLRTCYERLSEWIRTTAPQLERQQSFLRMLVRDTPVDPAQWFAQVGTPPTG